MIIPQEELAKYLGNDLSSLEGKIRQGTLEKLRSFAAPSPQLPVIDYFFLEHQQNKRSLNELAREVNLNIHTLKKIFDYYELPTLTNAEASKRNWQDPDFRERNAEAARRNWQDPDFRERNAEAVRRARLNPENIGKYHIPTIQGYRRDMGFNLQSTWEANFARILIYCNNEFSPRERFTRREFYNGESFKFIVPEEFRNLFKSNETEISIDFVVKEPRGNLVLYEIMAHPQEYPTGYAKLKMLIQQYPNIRVKTIDGRFYNRLRKHFEKRINSSQYLIGWETREDNLKTNPQKYS